MTKKDLEESLELIEEVTLFLQYCDTSLLDKRNRLQDYYKFKDKLKKLKVTLSEKKARKE